MSFFLKYAGTFLLGMLLALTGWAQVLKGTVKDTSGKAVPYANVNLKGPSAAILEYAVCNAKGEFSLAIPAGTTQTGLIIEVTCIGFLKQNKTIGDASAPYNFVLNAAANQLKEVIVKDTRPFIGVNGDTTSYKVSDYANKQDRVIGDVIKKLPGVQVASDGKITYNGKAISNLYIGGDNLLDDKYNIATNTIPQGAVDKVQVLENNQPVKMLRDKTVSEDVAMNLTFKKDAKLQMVGQEAIGAGIPGKYDVNLNAMMFKDNYKAINYIKGNNIGVDVENDLVSHNLPDYLQRIDNNKPTTLLSTGTANDPDLPRNRYLFNQSGLINLNNLVHLKKDVLLRTNLYYLHDARLQDYEKFATVYLPNDTIKYDETQQNRRRPNILHGQFTLNINKDKYYLNDNLTGDYNHNTSYSALNTNGTPVNQVFKDNIADFSNELNLMQTFGTNNILEVYSYINHIAEPENLQIAPGLNPQIFNNGNPYNVLTQKVNLPTWFTNNYLGYKIPSNGITQTYHMGFSWQQQKLRSDLLATQLDNVNYAAVDSAHNDLSWRRQRLYTEAIYDYPGDKLKVNVTLPLYLQQISYSDANFALDKQTTHLYFNPRLYVKYQVSAENYFTLLYNFRNQIGSIADVYNGYILKDYRTLFANSASLTEQKDQSAAVGFNYRKAITLFFFSLSARYDHISANSISSDIINNSFEQNIVLPFANSTNSWLLSGYISKYLFPLRTTLSGGLSWRSSSTNRVQNNVLLPFSTIITTANASVETKVSGKIDFSYKAVYSQLSSKSAAAASPAAVRSFFQQATLGYNPLERLSFKLSGDDYYAHTGASNYQKYVFADASVKYTFAKPKMDVELNANNLFNTRKYNELLLAANTFSSSTYVIPGRIIWLKFYFNI
ncbi:carboxypeptidase-like regulatory domain-containing protein [Mucilaginibacter sp. L3T2-6]|uniref:TonB-dependent receptor n=1 Tax=Mucilaginibacter sp. L3T2-6 TaxID=3062491 RepID=UPI00267592BB|nr:carboxypeptidase-like regulatory domain-containing protein [Mucilaginibacter sp. L3T2-6]MDO3642067.1 carboxypeptidase-like regulatory domain-containing protein [Mucilaginibacter sp. L3T2-6]MDV6214561.1 carboxypeptidase-like regulatory domain-containing protein [Mucilaginibacter sp. L3T2-6]